MARFLRSKAKNLGLTWSGHWMGGGRPSSACGRTELRKRLEGRGEKSDRAPVRQPFGHQGEAGTREGKCRAGS